MTTFSCTRMQTLLEAYEFFGEWIITDVLWLHYGTTMALILENGRSMPSDGSPPQAVRLTFTSVQELHLSNALNPSMLRNMHELNWGLSEIAGVQVENIGHFSSRYRDSPVTMLHAAILWEGERRIDLVFHSMTVEDLRDGRG